MFARLFRKSNCDHNHDPRGAVSSVEEDVLPLSVVESGMDNLRRWTAADIKAPEIFKLLGMDRDGKMLCKIGKRKVGDVPASFWQMRGKSGRMVLAM